MQAKRGLYTFLLIFFAVVTGARATPVTSTTYSGWLQNVTSPIDVFGSIQNNQSYNSSSGVSLSNSSHPSSTVVFTGPDNGGWSLSTRLYTYSSVNYTSLNGPGDGVGNITVTLPAGGENAVMLGLGTSQGTQLTVELSDGSSFTPAAGIFGIALTHDISWLTVSTTSGSNPIIFDFQYASSNLTQDQFTQDPAPTLEASTIVLIGGGLLVFIGGRRKFFGNTPR
jgi:hypothetical protein